MPKIYDNIHNKFADGLTEHLSTAARVDYCVGYFNLRGWRTVCNGIDKIPGGTVKEKDSDTLRYCRLLVGMTKTSKELLFEEFADPEDLMIDNEKANAYRKRLAIEFAEQLTIGMPTQGDEQVLKKLLEQLKSGRVVVKLFLKHQLHAKLYLAHMQGGVTPRISLLGSSNFTLSGLSKQGELNIDVLEQDAAEKLDKWFNDRWNDRWCIDITKDLIEILENSWARPDLLSPYLIYLKIVYHMSREARAGLAEFRLPTAFANELLDFQQAAVKIAAHHLHKRHGVMIGDVVGLGKTITATAVAKILEDDLYYNTLITCPKNLVPMWEKHREKYGLHARVISQSLLRRELPNLRRYRLIIVDESHNFRNNSGSTYRALKAYIDENESKVILLSATPYNKSYVDLANQLKLFLPDDFDLGIIPEQYVKALGGAVFFNAKHTDTNIKTINAFEKSNFSDDWREVMKLYLVRRTRSFIKNNYAKTDPASGRKYLEFSNGDKFFFPDRLPKMVGFALNNQDSNDQYAHLYSNSVVSVINALNLPRYGLQLYYNAKNDKRLNADEKDILDNLSRAGKRVLGFCRTNMYKRLESSGYSFMLSVARHILRNYIFIYAIKQGLKLPVSGQSIDVDLYTDEDDDNLFMDFSLTSDDYQSKAEEYYKEFSIQYAKRFKWIHSDLFDTKRLIDDLKTDADNLLSILRIVGEWIPKDDRKLGALCNLLTEKHSKDKVLIFTQFADTATYIFSELKKHNLRGVALAVGGSDTIVDTVNHFSPVSNECPVPKDKELRILVTTDVLSEGQNLQDAHIVINFDLPWAIVRLIQRAGRVDRLGQKSEQILCYSFLPEDGIEQIIGLRRKLSTRISENAEVVGSDEVFFEGDPINIADLYSEKSGIFDEEDDIDVDLASYAYQIWKNAIDANPKLKNKVENLPNVVFGAKENVIRPGENGVVVYVRTGTDGDALAWLNGDGEIVTQSQFTILKATECNMDTPTLVKLVDHHHLVAEGVERIAREEARISGTLGRSNGVKYRVYMRLKRFFEENDGTLFVPEGLKQALDDIYHNPLKEGAIDTLSRQIKAGIFDEALCDLFMTLHQEGKLCRVTDVGTENRQAQIICSMSLIGEAQ